MVIFDDFLSDEYPPLSRAAEEAIMHSYAS